MATIDEKKKNQQYQSAGTYQDTGLSDADRALIAQYKADYDTAAANNDYNGMTAAHDNAEAVRKKYGYSGGGDGSEYIKLDSANGGGAYQQAVAALNSVNSTRPVYDPSYDAQLADIYNQIVGRDKFSYDINSDMLYDQYRQQYTELGRLAMKDTMGQAAGLTGGYGSSYAQSVGQQQYDAYLQRLNDVIPDLYDRAYGKYRDEGSDLMQQYAMLGDLRDSEYGRYQDEYSRWAAERSYAQDVADTEYKRMLTSQEDARARIADFLAAGGSLDALDPELLAASGLTSAELSQLAASYQPAAVYYTPAPTEPVAPTAPVGATPAQGQTRDEWLQELYDAYGPAALELGASMLADERAQTVKGNRVSTAAKDSRTYQRIHSMISTGNYSLENAVKLINESGLGETEQEALYKLVYNRYNA